jgi:hypothetical protein
VAIAAPAQTVAPSAAVSAAPVAPVGKQVMIVADPIDSEVYIGDDKIGVAPVSVTVPDGKTLTLTIKANNYQDSSITINGSESRKVVQLKAKPVAGKGGRFLPDKPPAPDKGAKKPPSGTGGGEIVNPWN